MWRRLLVFGCAASASLALASGAPAKTPQLLVSGATEIGASAATVIRVKEEKTDAAPFRTSIYLPSGYVANLGQSAGTQVGTVTLSLQQLALSPDAIDVAGTIRTDTPSKYAGNLCAPGTHRAVWLLHLVVQGATFDVPAYVDPATGNDATFSSAKIVLCLSNPYEQAAPGTRAPFGVRSVDTRMTLKATATVPTRETDCANPLPVTAAPACCVAATIAGYKLSSNTVTAMPKKR